MKPAEQLQAWRAEFLAEIEGLELELTTAQQEQAEAEVTYRRASDEWAALRDTLTKPFSSSEEMAAPLYGRVGEQRREMLRSASGRRGAATAKVKAVEGTLSGRRLAIAQINRALEPVQGTKVREIGPQRPKTHPVVEFDNILAKEATHGTR